MKIILLCGGASPEREVSKSSSKSIYNALVELNYDVQIIDPALGKNQFKEFNKYFEDDDSSIIVSEKNYLETVNLDTFDNVDLVFNGLHGKYGEDGIIQAMLEARNIKQTGSGVLASALAMDKAMSKIIFRHNNVKTADWFLVKKKEFDIDYIKSKITKEFNYPCVVKPNDGGSTIGLTIVESEDQLTDAFDLAFKYSENIIVEDFINGRELTVGIIDMEPLPVLEIIPKHKIYDYECKYTDGMSEYIVPAKIPNEYKETLQQQALTAYKSIGCSGYGRVDFRVTKNYESFCFEINTLPGMTSHSLIPKMAKAAGIDFNSLIQRIISTAVN
jgi:D-alanine-D-alanine ligase